MNQKSREACCNEAREPETIRIFEGQKSFCMGLWVGPLEWGKRHWLESSVDHNIGPDEGAEIPWKVVEGSPGGGGPCTDTLTD